MTAEQISAPYFINPFHQFLCLHVYPLIVARQLLGKNYLGEEHPNKKRSFISQKLLKFKKNGVFWDFTPCGCCTNERFGGT
jgi:hypothetical protein